MKHRNSDPSINRNTRSKATRAGVAGALLALTLLGAAADSSTPIKQTVAEGSVRAPKAEARKAGPETAKEALNDRIQKSTIAFAAAIRKLHETAGNDAEKFAQPTGDNNGMYNVGVKIKSGTSAGGDYGDYFVMVTVRKDRQRKLDPTTASQVFIGMDDRKNGENPEAGYGHFYGFEVIQMGRNWRVIHHLDNKNGEGPVIYNSTEPEAVPAGPGILREFDMDQFNLLARQAANVLAGASNREPVSYPSVT